MTKHRRISKQTALLLIGILSGCSFFDTNNPFKSERPEQMVPGERHPPLLNTMQTTSPSTTSGSSVSSGLVRKPIPGNQAAAAIPVSPPVVPAPPQIVPKATLASASAADVPPSPQVQADAPKPVERPSFFDRLFGAPSQATDDQLPPPWKLRDESGNTPVIDDKETPALSSVPTVPPQFKTLKASRDQQIQEMQSDSDRATQQKNALDSEPSRQNATPDSAPQPQIAEPSDSHTPRRGIDIMTQEEWDALMKKRQENNAAPGPQSDASPLQKLKEIAALFSPVSEAYAADDSSAQPLNVPSWAIVKAPDNSAVQAVPQPASVAPVEMPVATAPKVEAVAVDANVAPAADKTPEQGSFFSRVLGDSTEIKISPPPETSPLAVSETRVPPVVNSDVALTPPPMPPAPVTPSAALPSPKILEEVKVQTPARYSALPPSQTLHLPSQNPASN